jgi:NDP-sugar pyrophosphorylase family protein
MEIEAVILVGGLGTRLHALYPDTPKVLVPVAGASVLERQVAWLAGGGIRSIHLATGHLSEAVEAWVGNYTASDVRIRVSREPGPLGTAGGIRHALQSLDTEFVLAMNGDSLLPNLCLQELINAHTQADASATIAVTRIEAAGRYGTVEFEEDGRVTAFREKAERSGGWINGGVYLLSRGALAGVEPGVAASMEHEVFPGMAEAETLHAFPVEPPLLDMGTPEGLAAMERWFTKHP